MTNRATIAVVIVNWNGWQMTLRCLEALRSCRLDNFDWHAYIIDNASTDDSREKLVGLGPTSTVILAPTNGGWTGGNNLGVKLALENEHSFIFLLNNDAIIEANALRELVAAHSERMAEQPIFGCLQRTDDGKDFTFITIEIDPRSGLLVGLSPERYEVLLQQRFMTTPVVNGAALFAHRQVFETVGAFDERFYLNFDESDWCLRAGEAGHSLYTLRDAVIFHSGNKSIGGAASPLQQYFMFRNQLLFSEIHGTPIQRLRVVRSLVSRMRDITGRNGWIDFLRKVFFPPPVVRAMGAGVRDYLLRRFGNCPDMIRKL